MDSVESTWDIYVCSLNIYTPKQMKFLDYHCYLMETAGIRFCFFGLEESTEFYNKCLNRLTVVYIEISHNWLTIDKEGRACTFSFFSLKKQLCGTD